MIEHSHLQWQLRRLESCGVRLGLETIRRLLQALDEPQRKLRAVLVAGTNGKGSTAAFLASIATAAGYRTGLFTSPHLESVEERIRIDGRALASDRLDRELTRVIETSETALGCLPTYFEALTATAFRVFAGESIDLAVLEVGLGGRLDATNVVDPELSLITEIGLEHQEYLGDTLESIAREKAGVLRACRPAILGVQRTQARRAIEAVVAEVGALPIWVAESATIGRQRPQGREGQQIELTTRRARYRLFSVLGGDHQATNLAMAVLAAEALAARGLARLTASAVTRGVAATRWPGRMEWVELPAGRWALLDVAHNADGASALERALRRLEGGYILLFGALSDKQVGAVLPPLAERAARVVLTTPQSERALPPEALAPLVPRDKVVLEPNRESALAAALALSGGLVVACGSVYLVGAIRELLRRRFGAPPPAVEIACSG